MTLPGMRAFPNPEPKDGPCVLGGMREFPAHRWPGHNTMLDHDRATVLAGRSLLQRGVHIPGWRKIAAEVSHGISSARSA